MQALRAEAWLHTHGKLDSPQGRAIELQFTGSHLPRSAIESAVARPDIHRDRGDALNGYGR